MASQGNNVNLTPQRMVGRATVGLLVGIPVALLLAWPALQYARELGPDSTAGFLLLAGVAGIPIFAAMIMGLTTRHRPNA